MRDDGYDPKSFYDKDDERKAVIDWLASDYFSPDEGLFYDLSKFVGLEDPYFVLADYRSYIEAQERINKVYSEKSKWAEMAILNVAGSGKFLLIIP